MKKNPSKAFLATLCAITIMAGCGKSDQSPESHAEEKPQVAEQLDPAKKILNDLQAGLSGRWRSALEVVGVENAEGGKFVVTINQKSVYQSDDDQGFSKNWFLDSRYRLTPSDTTIALVWSLAYGYGFAISENQNPEPAFSGRKWGAPVQKVAHDAIEESVNKMFAYTQVFDGIGPEKIERLVVRNYVGEERPAKVDEYGKKIQDAGTRVKLLDECILDRGGADKFEWPNVAVSYMNQSGWSIPDAVEREAKKATKCTLINGPWTDS